MEQEIKEGGTHIYIQDRETKMIVAEAKDGSSLFQIQQLESTGKFDQEYFVTIRDGGNPASEDDFLGYYPASWDPYVVPTEETETDESVYGSEK